jgi:hypothetical protein
MENLELEQLMSTLLVERDVSLESMSIGMDNKGREALCSNDR